MWTMWRSSARIPTFPPYDSGSYASSTTYITDMAVVKACNELKKQICTIAAGMMDCGEEAVVDCGIPINPNLARIQTEGGIVQGIGHTLMENVTYDRNGRPAESSFMQYKLPTRLDMGRLKVEFEHSYEPTGPFGAKSIGEIVINTPGPAIAHAIYRATGKWFRELPITPEQIAMSLTEE